MNAPQLNVTIDQETGELHTLDGCPGFHPEKSCGSCSVACLDGATDDLTSHPRGTNALLVYSDLLIGSRLVMGLSGPAHQPSGPGSSVRLHVNGTLFTLDGPAQPQPVWAVTVTDRCQEDLYVSVYTTLQAAVASATTFSLSEGGSGSTSTSTTRSGALPRPPLSGAAPSGITSPGPPARGPLRSRRL